MASLFIFPWLVTLLLASIHLERFTASAQNCYYPDGSLSNGTSRDAPCSKDGGICCPLNWECLSNGLCYYEPDDYYERKSCTDPTWEACPDICLYDYTAYGGEAILHCSNGEWCCDKNRVSGVCCTDSDAEFFDLKQGQSFATITALADVTSPASTADNAQTSGSDNPFSESSAPKSTSSSTAVTSESVTTGKDGSVSTITKLTTVAPANTEASQPEPSPQSSDSNSNLGMIIGLALGIPLVIILAAIAIFLCIRKRRRNNDTSYNNLPPTSPPIEAKYANIPPGTHAPEVDGYPVASTANKENRSSELYGNDTYIYSPSVKSPEASPPSYSDRSPKSPGMERIREEREPQELWGGYVPYRPPQRTVERSPVSPEGTGVGSGGEIDRNR